MKKISFIYLAILLIYLVSSCVTRHKQSQFDKKTSYLAELIDDNAFKQIEGLDDPEVEYLLATRRDIDDAARKLFSLHSSLEENSITDKSGLTIYLLQMLGMYKQVENVSNSFKSNILYMQTMLEQKETDSKSSYGEIKRSLLDGNDAVSQTYTLFLTDLDEYKQAETELENVLTEVLDLVSPNDLTPAINKITGPEVQAYYIACLDYLTKLLEFEKGRALDVIKAQDLFSKIN